MKKNILVMAIIASTAFIGCSDDDDNNNSTDCLTCGKMTICKISDTSNKVKVTALGETYEADLPEGKTFKDVNCDNTLEMIGFTAE